MFPYAHAKSISIVSIKLFTQCFHTSNLEVVNPSSDKLIKSLYFIAVANAPATTSEFPHPLLILHY